MSVKADRKPEAPLADALGAAAGALPGAGTGWLDQLRGDAAARYRGLGLPTVRDEAWKYTNLRRVQRLGLQRPGLMPAPAAVAPDGIGDSALRIDALQVVLVNGRLDRGLSALDDLPDGLSIFGLADLLERDPAALEGALGAIAETEAMPLAALNTALLEDGVVIRIAEGAVLERAIHVLSIGAGVGEVPVAFHPRLLVQAGVDSVATLVESHVGTGSYFANVVAEVALGRGALFNHYKLQDESGEAFHVALAQVVLDARAAYDSFALQVGGALARNEVRLRFAGEGAEAHVNGVYLGRGACHLDNTSLIDHAVAHCRSRQVFKGVLDDSARGVFQGKVLVRPGAQKTDAHQLNKALLLSDSAEIDAKPELMIYADDVKCSHGATAGELEDEALFYLRARGIDEDTARGLLLAAFVEDALEEVQSPAVRDALATKVHAWLAAHAAGSGKVQSSGKAQSSGKVQK